MPLYGLTSLGPSFLAGTLGHTSHALAGVPAFAAFTAAVAAQLAAGAWDVRRLLATGMAALSAGIVLVVVAMWAPSLALFLAGGVPVLGLGIIGQLIEPKVALLAFAALLLAAIAASARTLLGGGRTGNLQSIAAT